MKKICLLTVCLCLSGQVMAEDDPFAFDLTEGDDDTAAESSAYDYRFSNAIEGRLRKFTRRSDFLSSRLRLNSSLLLDAGAGSLYVNGFFDYDEAVHAYDKRFRAYLYELYGRINGSEIGLSGSRLSVGKIRLSWGVNDGRSTIDVINATYMPDPMANGRTVYKWPAWMARIEQSTSMGNIEGVILPFGKDRREAEYGSPWELESVHELRTMERDGVIFLNEHVNPRKPEWGGRYIKYMSGFDFGAAYYSGFSDLPVVRRVSANSFLMEPVRSRVVNISGAMSAGSSTLRAEAAYTRDAAVYDRNGNVYYTDLKQVIAGWDRNFNNDVYANIQLFIDHYDSFQDDYGLTLSLSRKYFHDALNLGVNAMYGYKNEHSVETFAEYIVNDSLTINLRGYWIGGGTDSSVYHSYERNDYVEIGFKYYL